MSSEFLRITGISANLTVPSEGMAMFRHENKWGFMDMSGNRIIEPAYDSVKAFNGGFAAVCLNNKWGFIDKKGNVVGEIKYDYAAGFVNEAAIVMEDKKYGFLNKYFEEITPKIYDDVTFFAEGLAGACLGDKWGFIDMNGKLVLNTIYRRDESYNTLYKRIGFSEGLSIVLSDSGSHCFIDTKGEVVITLDNMKPIPFCNGISNVLSNNFCGLINKKGETILPANEYNIIFNFNDGLAAATKNGKWGYIDHNGEIKIPLIYDSARTFSDGFSNVKENGKWHTIDKEGQRVGDKDFDYAYGFVEGYAYVENNGELAYIDTQGNIVIKSAVDIHNIN